jgi:hypothetical protein
VGSRVRGDGGQAAPLLCVLVLLTGVAALALGRLGGHAVDGARAATAADAAALAAAGEAGDEEAAHRVAAANGGEVVAFRHEGPLVEVDVRVGERTARARASNESNESGGREGGDAGRADGGDRAGLAPELTAALARADALLGRPVPVMSGLRSAGEQAALWARRAENPYPVARPGSSAHVRGTAVDVPRAFVDELLAVAPAAGLCQPLPETDPVHFVPCPTSTR